LYIEASLGDEGQSARAAGERPSARGHPGGASYAEQ